MKPCPFCGANRLEDISIGVDDELEHYHIFCGQCMASGPARLLFPPLANFISPEDFDTKDLRFKTKELAKKAWNAREE